MKAGKISKITVVGAGTMGANIAGLFARTGCDVRVTDVDQGRLRNGMRILKNSQKGLVEAKILTQRKVDSALKRITWTADLKNACCNVHLLIEAVSEDLSLKKHMFSQFDKLCPKKAVLASNTSGLAISEISSVTKRPDLVAGMHFWNPPHIIPLVEVTKGRKTSDTTVQLLMDIARRIGKSPILVNHDIPGFVGNRLQFAVFREALHLLSEGVASAEDIDTAMTAGPGLRYGLQGPLRTADLGGLDIFQAISSYLFDELSAAKKPPALLSNLVQKKKLGAKTGHGFYRYTKAEVNRTVARRDKVLLEFLKVMAKC
jgi:3-hydroxybutyryl-CoA dehydrogenase